MLWKRRRGESVCLYKNGSSTEGTDVKGNLQQGPSLIGDNNQITYILNGILSGLVIFIEKLSLESLASVSPFRTETKRLFTYSSGPIAN